MLNIVKSQDKGVLTITLDGRMDITTAPDLEQEIKSSLNNNVNELILDCAGLTYISSAGLRVVFSAHKKMNKQGSSMKLIHVNEMVMDVFETMGLAEYMMIE